MALRTRQVTVIGDELAVAWSDGTESFLKLTTLRRLCPCAGCAGERDLLGRLMKGPDRPLTSSSFEVVRTLPVGGYAVQIFWGDGHSDGLYPFAKLREWGERPPELPPLPVLPTLPVR
jgi:DUF971 family protein